MASIESYVKPQRLYRYRSLKTPEEFEREVEAIEKGYLFCAAYMNLNDPMEGIFTSSQTLRNSVQFHEIREAIIDRKTEIGMCSFSEVNNHELMWAHYADHYRGICVAYNLSRLLKKLEKNFTFVRIYYNEKAPTVGKTNRERDTLAKMVLSYKNYRWLYEREWRMFGSLGEAYYRDTTCVSRVYLGSRMNRRNREQIGNTLKKLGIKTSDMTIRKYSISFKAQPPS